MMSEAKQQSSESSPEELRDFQGVDKGIRPPGYDIWCIWCGSPDNLRRCGRCHSAFYCSKEHQRAHWRTHRQECVERARPEEINPASVQDNSSAQPASTLTTLDYTTSSSTCSPAGLENTNPVAPTQTEINSLLNVGALNVEQITDLLPNVGAVNFHNIDLGMLLTDNLSDTSEWSKLSSGSFESKVSSASYEPKINSGSYDPKLSSESYESKMNSGSYEPKVNSGPYESKMSSASLESKVSSGSHESKLSSGSYESNISSRSYESKVNSGSYESKVSSGLYADGTSAMLRSNIDIHVPVQAQDSPQYSNLVQENNTVILSYSQMPEPPPYEFTENSSFVESNLVQLDVNLTNQENSNVISQPVEPIRLPIQHYLYELSDLTNTENVCRDISADIQPLPLSILTPEFLNRICSNVVNDMNKFGICVIDNFLGRKTGEAILAEVKELYSDGIFQEGQVVNTSHRTISKTIRGDRITWVNGKEEHCRFVGFLIHILDTIVTRCLKMKNSGLFGKCKVNRRTKAMIACYPGNGTHYVKHVDNPNEDGRCITTIYYLNQFWDTQRHGGLLRMFPAGCDNQVANIEPLFDRMLFFWSDRRNPHEVLPAFSVRFAITVWYCNAEESSNVLQRYRKEVPKQNTEAQGLKQMNPLTD